MPPRTPHREDDAPEEETKDEKKPDGQAAATTKSEPLRPASA